MKTQTKLKAMSCLLFKSQKSLAAGKGGRASCHFVRRSCWIEELFGRVLTPFGHQYFCDQAERVQIFRGDEHVSTQAREEGIQGGFNQVSVYVPFPDFHFVWGMSSLLNCFIQPFGRL